MRKIFKGLDIGPKSKYEKITSGGHWKHSKLPPTGFIWSYERFRPKFEFWPIWSGIDISADLADFAYKNLGKSVFRVPNSEGLSKFVIFIDI